MNLRKDHSHAFCWWTTVHICVWASACLCSFAFSLSSPCRSSRVVGHIHISAMCSCHRVFSCTFLVQAPVCWINRYGWFRFLCPIGIVLNLLEKQLSATDVSARTLMKGTAKCDKHCELQNSVNQQGFERILRFRDIPESMPASASFTRSYLRLSEVSLCSSFEADAFSGYPTCCCDNAVKCALCVLLCCL